MRYDTSHREKGRAVFLSVIMVLSVVAMSAAFAGTTAAQDRSYDDQTIYETSIIWQGQEVEVTGLNESTDYDLYSVEDGFETQFRTDDTGNLLIETDELEGDYYIAGEDHERDDGDYFTVAAMNLEASFDSEEVATESDIAVGLELDSDRRTYDVNVSEADESFDEEELADIFGDAGADVVEHEDSITIEDAEGEWDTNWANVTDEGNYTFEFSVTDTAAEANASIEVVDVVVDLEFIDKPYDAQQAGIANFTIDMQGADEAALRFGDFSVEDDNYYEIGVTVNASDYDGDIVHVPMNLYTAGGAEVFEAVGQYPVEQFTFMEPEVQDGVEIELEYMQANAEAHVGEGPVTEEHLLYVFDGMLESGTYDVDVGSTWDGEIEAEWDEDLGHDVVDADFEGPPSDVTTLNVDPISMPGDFEQHVAPGTESVQAGMSQEDFAELTLTQIEEGESVAADFEEERGDHVVGVIEDVDLDGAIWVLNDVIVEELGMADNFGDALHQADSGIEITLEQEADNPLQDDVTATTNATLYENEELNYERLNVTGLTTGDYEGDLHVSIPYFEIDGLSNGDVTVSVDYSDAAGDLDLPDDADLEESLDTRLGAPDLALDDITEMPIAADAAATGTTNIAPGHEMFGQASSDTEPRWVATGSGEVHEDGFTVEYDTTEGDEQDTFDLEVSQGYFGVSDELENVVLGERPGDAQFAVTADAPDQVDVDEDASLDVTVTNVGEQAGTSDYTVTIDGDAVDEQTLEDWESGAEESFSYDFETDEEAEISWSVETDDETASGELTVGDDPDDPDTDEPDEADDDEDDDDDVPGFGVAVAIVALLGAAMLALRRQD